MLKEYLIATLAAAAALAVAFFFWTKRKVEPTDPIEILVKQAAKFRWQRIAKVDEDGVGAKWTQQSIRFTRGSEEVIIWYKDATITLVRVHAPPTFESFLELENWIAHNPNDNDDDPNPDVIYLREIEKFIIRHGHFEDLLEASATDEKFFRAIFDLKRAGLATKEDPVIVAALILDALTQYESDRGGALTFLAKTTADL